MLYLYHNNTLVCSQFWYSDIYVLIALRDILVHPAGLASSDWNEFVCQSSPSTWLFNLQNRTGQSRLIISDFAFLVAKWPQQLSYWMRRSWKRWPDWPMFRSMSFPFQAFRLFDSNNDGRISTEEFLKLLKKIGGIMTGGQAKSLLTLVGINQISQRSISGATEYLIGWQGWHWIWGVSVSLADAHWRIGGWPRNQKRVWKIWPRQKWLHHKKFVQEWNYVNFYNLTFFQPKCLKWSRPVPGLFRTRWLRLKSVSRRWMLMKTARFPTRSFFLSGNPGTDLFSLL